MSNSSKGFFRGASDGVILMWVGIAVSAAVLTVVWVAVKLGHHLAGLGGSPHGPLSVLFGLLKGTVAWPVQSTVIAVFCTVLLLAAAAGIARKLAHRVDTEPSRAMASRSQVAALTPAKAGVNAGRLRPTLKGRPRKGVESDHGIAIGKLLPRGPQLRASWEDVIVAVMAPRSGKTTSLAVPAILDAPGPVVATSNKPDLWAATAQPRRSSTGQDAWVFDPQTITHQPQGMWWDPLAGLRSVEDSDRLAGMFVLTVEDKNAKDIWGPAAKEMLAALFMAARVGGHDIVQAYRWLNDLTQRPSALLRDAGFEALASSLEGFRNSPAETKGSVIFTAKVAVQCLREPHITKWVTPPEDGGSIPVFDAGTFATSRQTLYLLSKDGGGGAAPLVAALTDRLMRTATVAAEMQGGRLDPPMVVALDEAANICRIGDLPELYSHLGSRGIIPITILQSYAQGTRVWGAAGMRTLWSAATIKMIGSGIDDASFAEDLSRLIGEHEVDSYSRSTGGGRGGSTTHSERRERILPAAQIRALPKGQAIVMATGMPPAMVQLQPWYESRQAAVIQQATSSSIDLITRQARQEQQA